jgi:N-acetylglucosaminyl-diphospho-decaprenol L-rhamnosyltransferase
MITLTTIIVAFNTRSELEDCLASIAAYPPRVGHEIIVVDNASSDGTVAALRTRWPDVRVIEAGRNSGFAAANNLGIRAATSDLVLLLNSDTRVTPGALDAMVVALIDAPDVAALGPRIVDGSGRAELSFGRMMTPWNELRQKVIVRQHERGNRLVSGWVERATRRVRHPDWVSGACLLVRRPDALAAGLLDERYFLYAEDVDFCAALRGMGKRIQFFPGAEIVHLRGRSGRQRPAATERAYRSSHVAFYEKHHPTWARVLKGYLRVRGQWPADGPRV